MESLDNEDKQLVDFMRANEPRIKPSANFAPQVLAKIRRQQSRSVLSPKRRSWIWGVSVFAHAAALLVIASLIVSSSSSSTKGPTLSVEQVVYNQRSAAIKNHIPATIDADQRVHVSFLKTGEGVRLVPLKSCLAGFDMEQWERLAPGTRKLYQQEDAFTLEQVGAGQNLKIPSAIKAKYFAQSQSLALLKLDDRFELWDRDVLMQYIDEFPVRFKGAAIITVY